MGRCQTGVLTSIKMIDESREIVIVTVAVQTDYAYDYGFGVSW